MESLPSEIWQRAFSDSWNILNGLGGIIFQTVLFAMTAIMTWRKEGSGALRKIFLSGLSGSGLLAGAWIITLLLHFAVLSPRELLKAERTAKTAAEEKLTTLKKATPEPIPFQITETDTQAREQLKETQKQLNDTKRELATAQETIQKLDPREQPIASVVATAQVFLKSDTKFGNHYLDRGGSVGFGRGTEPLLVLYSYDSFAQTVAGNEAVFESTFDRQVEGSLLGKPIAELRKSEYIQLHFETMPPDSEILRGKVVFTVNGSQKFEFAVAPQKSQGKRIMLHDMYSLRKLLSPSPTP